MSENFNLEIISPDEMVLKSEADEVSIPSFEGQMTILKDHIALITYLRPGFIQVSTDGKKEVFFVEEGIVEFSKNNLLILSSTVINIKNLTGAIKESIIKESTTKLNSNEINDKERYILAYKIESLKEIAQ
ncbi:MAG: ATP synthase F1 subunit epsilon [Pelagibacterales bacterium MED-G40]|nr:MAG: ATP synthase F1 subunit epsilon [Pelagibacterales bacterium MED-G40]|tara:strand:+ start:397 stop:789 length:393 start_codon:yes stop_codon:yes gene_type:complete